MSQAAEQIVRAVPTVVAVVTEKGASAVSAISCAEGTVISEAFVVWPDGQRRGRAEVIRSVGEAAVDNGLVDIEYRGAWFSEHADETREATIQDTQVYLDIQAAIANFWGAPREVARILVAEGKVRLDGETDPTHATFVLSSLFRKHFRANDARTGDLALDMAKSGWYVQA